MKKHKKPLPEDLRHLLTESIPVEEQIRQQLAAGKKPNPLAEMEGKWPGDESLEELLGMLRK